MPQGPPLLSLPSSGTCPPAIGTVPLSGPATASGEKGAPGLFGRYRSVSAASGSNTPSGSPAVVRVLPSRLSVFSARSPSNTIAGNAVRRLLYISRSVNDSNPPNTSSGSRVRELSPSHNSLNASSPSNNSAGSVPRSFECRYRCVSAPNPRNTPSGSVSRSLKSRPSISSASNPSNTSTGSVSSWLLDRLRSVAVPNPAKSPALRSLMLRPLKSNSPVIVARCGSVTSAQSLTPEIWSTR